jgi:integrative and conjugative element protein (TIGR02256 family)
VGEEEAKLDAIRTAVEAGEESGLAEGNVFAEVRERIGSRIHTIAMEVGGGMDGPRPSDLRYRHLYIPDRSKEQSEINAMNHEGFHFVGDWYTHPEPIPAASPSDLKSIRDAFAKSKHHLNWFIMIIAGTKEFPSGLHVAAHGAKAEVKLGPITLLKDGSTNHPN